MNTMITDTKPVLQNRATDSDGHESFEEWIAYKRLCRKMFEDAQLSLVVSREDYFAQLETVVSIHKSIAKGSHKF